MREVTVPLLDLKLQYNAIKTEIDEAIRRVVDSQHFILGPEVSELEREIAEYCGCAHAVGCASGSDAILLALMALGVGAGDQVICPAHTFFATAGSIARLGAVPVFV
ncbi:MAG: DegT/DnrJ/EryC1/StrS family aminotransferase, partial [Phycisphaerales bacterium]